MTVTSASVSAPHPITPQIPAARRRRVQRILDGVVASYIHEISARAHAAPMRTPAARRA